MPKEDIFSEIMADKPKKGSKDSKGSKETKNPKNYKPSENPIEISVPCSSANALPIASSSSNVNVPNAGSSSSPCNPDLETSSVVLTKKSDAQLIADAMTSGLNNCMKWMKVIIVIIIMMTMKRNLKLGIIYLMMN